MKTMKDFKGTQGELKTRKVTSELYFSHEMYADNNKFNVVACLYNRDEESEANARLFANSKRVLEAAIETSNFLDYAEKNSMKTETSEFWKELVYLKNKLEQAINDSL